MVCVADIASMSLLKFIRIFLLVIEKFEADETQGKGTEKSQQLPPSWVPVQFSCRCPRKATSRDSSQKLGYQNDTGDENCKRCREFVYPKLARNWPMDLNLDNKHRRFKRAVSWGSRTNETICNRYIEQPPKYTVNIFMKPR